MYWYFRKEKTMNYEQWHKEYHEKKIGNPKKELDEKDILILAKLGIEIKDKEYTEYELEVLTIEVGAYYRDETMNKFDLEFTKDLKITGVTKEEYTYIQDKVDSLYNKFSKYFAKFRLEA